MILPAWPGWCTFDYRGGAGCPQRIRATNASIKYIYGGGYVMLVVYVWVCMSVYLYIFPEQDKLNDLGNCGPILVKFAGSTDYGTVRK